MRMIILDLMVYTQMEHKAQWNQCHSSEDKMNGFHEHLISVLERVTAELFNSPESSSFMLHLIMLVEFISRFTYM